MAKKVASYIKLQVPAGQANPSPPVGPALGQHGVNIMEFCKAFNAQTQGTEPGLPIPVIITVYAIAASRSFPRPRPPLFCCVRLPAFPRVPARRTPTRLARSIVRSSKRSPRPRCPT